MTWVVGMTTGAGLGFAYFGGLWLTVRHVVSGRRRSALLRVSGGVRLALVALTFYGLSCEGPEMLLAGLAGLWLARWCLLRQLGGVRYDR